MAFERKFASADCRVLAGKRTAARMEAAGKHPWPARAVSPPETVTAHHVAMKSFNPYSPDPKPCWHCTNFLALTAQGSAAVCGRSAVGDTVTIVSTPKRGCAFFCREVGVDDEPDWVPQALSTEATQALVAKRVQTSARTGASVSATR
jgi:hypothetical protein